MYSGRLWRTHLCKRTERERRDNEETKKRKWRNNGEITERQRRDNGETTERQRRDNGREVSIDETGLISAASGCEMFWYWCRRVFTFADLFVKVQLLALNSGQFMREVQQCDLGAFLFCREGKCLLGTVGSSKGKERVSSTLEIECCTLSVLHIECFTH
jgi:hypothetical protein